MKKKHKQKHKQKQKRKRQRARNRIAIIVIAAFGAVALLLMLVQATGQPDRFGPQSQDPTAYNHVEAFQAIADEHGDRAAGTTGYEASAQYVERQLSSLGYESWRQEFTFEYRGEEIVSFNIIAETDGGSDDNVIMLGAHLDGVPGSAAINDNASGVAALLAAAKELGQSEEIENKVRFAWWGAEEFPEPQGSRHYVEDLAENDSGELDSIAAYLNFDMVASPNYVIAVYDARESSSRLHVPEGSVEIMDILTDYLDSRGQPWTTTYWNFASDQQAFVKEDVAVGGLFTGDRQEKTARQANLFGGTANEPRDPNYHTPGDDISNVNREVLGIMTDAITHAATSLAEDSSALE